MYAQDAVELTQKDYEMFRRLIYDKSGINLGDSKAQLLRSRLSKRLREGQFNSFRDYYDFVVKDEDGHELVLLLDAVSTNTTHLFRENGHFDFLREIVPQLAADPTWKRAHPLIRVWSAGCSSGEEPHTLAIVLHDLLDKFGGVDFKILATDISTRMLTRGKTGIYDQDRLQNVSKEYLRRYFTRTARDAATYQVNRELQDHISFARLNLMSATFPFRNGFEFIFCRNVMIYFDRATQQALVGKFARHLKPGGYLLIGHSESLNSIDHPLQYVRPTIYQKPALR